MRSKLFNRAHAFFLFTASGILGLIAFVAVGTWFSNTVITLTDDGFSPRVVVVRKGATVRFSSNRGRYFWPASDPHPIHTKELSFDPKRAIAPQGQWEFVPMSAGIWTYHDHTAPQFRGTVIVLAGDSSVLSYVWGRIGQWARIVLLNTQRQSDAYFRDCGPLGKDCWDRAFLEVVNREGSREALRMVDYLRRTYPEFANYCHQYADFIGDISYWNIPAARRVLDFDISLAGQCSSGYMHGYMGEFMSHGIFAQGVAFCDQIRAKYPGTEAALECYRGIGNGLTFQNGFLYWNDETAIVDHALAGCSGLAEEDACRSGVFVGIDHMHFGVHGFELRRDPNDPFALCRGRDTVTEAACYDATISSFFAAVGYDLSEAAKHLRILPLIHAKRVVEQVVKIPYELEDFERKGGNMTIIAWCRSIGGALHPACFRGFVLKLYTIDVEYNGQSSLAREFCGNSFLNQSEKDMCQQIFNEAI